MTGVFAMVLLLKVTLALSFALAMAWWWRRRSAAERHLVLTAALLAIAVMPFAAAWAPSLDVPAPIELATAGESWPNAVFLEATSKPVRVAPAEDRAAHARRPWYGRVDPRRLLLIVWLLGAAMSLGPVAIGVWEIRQVRRHAPEWRHRWALLRSACRDVGLRRHVQLLLDEAGPATFGILRPVVLLPPDARRWNRAAVRRAVIHELEHVRRHDCLVHLVGRVVCAMYWWHPLVWVVWRQVELEAERACDDAVVRVGEPVRYADQLVALAERAVARARKPLLAMASRNDLTRRVLSVLADDLPRGGARVRSVCVVAACAALLVAIVAPLRAVNSGVSALATPPAIAIVPVQPAASPAEPMVRPVSPLPARADARAESRGTLLTNASEAVSAPASPRIEAETETSSEQVGQNALPEPRFEAASIKRNTSGDVGSRGRVLPSGQVSQTNTFALTFIAMAYPPGPTREVVGLPDWAQTDRYDMVGVGPAGATRDQMQQMWRALLAERMKLAAHYETKEAPIYRMVLAHPDQGLGPGAKASDCGPATASTSGPCAGFSAANGRITTTGRGLGALATLLRKVVGRAVEDETGIDGVFTIELAYRPLNAINDDRPSVFVALEEQLGLKLVSDTESVKVLVIDHIERPSEN